MRRSLNWMPAAVAAAMCLLPSHGAHGENLSISGAQSSPPVTLQQAAPLPAPPPGAPAGIPRQQIDRQSGAAVTPAADARRQGENGQSMALNFESAPIREVIKNICELLNMNYIIEQDIKGFVTIRTLNKIPVAGAIDLLDQLLILNGITRVKIGNYWRFLPAAAAIKEPLQVYKDPAPNEFAARDRYAIQILTFNYVGADQILELIKPFLSKEASATVLQRQNMLLVVERGTKLPEIESLSRAIDVDSLDTMQVKLFDLKNAGAGEVAQELTAVYATMGYVKPPPAQGIVFLPLDRLNSILMVNPFPNLYPGIKEWLDKLDTGSIGSAEVTTHIYHVQHGDAENLAGILRQLYVDDKKQKANAQAAAGPAMVEGPVLILHHPDTNSIIIRTAERNFQIIGETLKRLDQMPQQVLIEVLIAEIQLSDNLEFGLEWAMASSGGGSESSVANNLGGLSPSGATNVAANLGNTAFNPVGSAQGLSVFARNSTNVMGLLHTLATQSKLDIKASPILMTSNNKAASIDITNEVPISTITTTQTGATAQNIQYRSVGIRLSVTPKINEQSFVSLIVDQEISQIDDGRKAEFKALGISAMPLLRRQAKSSIVVKNRETLILGGMISEQKGGGKSGIPWLSDIPFLGWLFGTNSKTSSKTELLILLTPHVIGSEEEARAITERYKEQIKDLQLSAKNTKAEAPAPEAPLAPGEKVLAK
ncbi:MAG: type II secretion system secretin GspD [Nitrospinae bacterium]|nr:type II secretion system secretin GspD [Nitrospinota bacterium]